MVGLGQNSKINCYRFGIFDFLGLNGVWINTRTNLFFKHLIAGVVAEAAMAAALAAIYLTGATA